MNFTDILNKFVKKQKEKGESSEEISKAVFMVMSVCVFKTLKDIKGSCSEEEWKDFLLESDKMNEIKTVEEYQVFVNERADLRIGDSGKTFGEVTEENLKEMFEEVGK
jgi:hypothetical protein